MKCKHYKLILGNSLQNIPCHISPVENTGIATLGVLAQVMHHRQGQLISPIVSTMVMLICLCQKDLLIVATFHMGVWQQVFEPLNKKKQRSLLKWIDSSSFSMRNIENSEKKKCRNEKKIPVLRFIMAHQLQRPYLCQ